MTWIVGLNTVTSSAILVSDIQVTFTDAKGSKTYKDCLRKIHQLHRSVIGGFAGSVAIGFKVLAILQNEFGRGTGEGVWDLNIISNTWLPRIIRRAFSESDEKEKCLGCQIILAGVNARKATETTIPITSEVYVFKSPNFEQEKAVGFNLVSIGSGNNFDGNVERLKTIVSDIGFHNAALAGPQASGQIVANFVHDIFENQFPQGVSRFSHIGFISRENSMIFPFEFERIASETSGRPSEKIIMPTVANSPQEFLKYCKTNRFDSATAVS